MRGFDLAGMFGPRAEARAIAGRATADLADSITGAGQAIGAGITRKRQEAESKRRYGIEKGFEERRLDIAEYDAALRGEAMDLQKEERLEKAAAADGLLDGIEEMSQKFAVMSQMGVSPSDQDWSQFNAHVTALGGEQAVQGAFGIRASNGGAVPTQDQDDIFDLDARLRRNEERRVQVDGLMKQANALASSKSGKTAARARLANAGLLNAKAALDAESTSLQRRYALAGKQQKSAEENAASAALRSQKEALAPGLRAQPLPPGMTAEERETALGLWLADDKAPVRSIESSLFRERGADARDRAFQGTQENRAAVDADRDRAFQYRTEQDKARATESKRRWETSRADRMVRKKDGSLDADRIGAALDKQAFEYGWSEDLEAGLSDDEIRAALSSKTLGPGVRSKVEEVAKRRGVPLLPSEPAPAAGVGGAPAREADTAIDQAIAEAEKAGKGSDLEWITARAEEIRKGAR